jgi:hypothetical protein
MNFDSRATEKLLSLSDAELWATLKSIASMNGISLPSTAPSPAEMQKLRGIFKGGEGLSLEKAREIVEEYKKGSK